MRLVVEREIPVDPKLRRQWNDLVFQMESPQVFYTWEWALAVQSAYRTSLKPLLFLAYEGDDLVGVASLATSVAGDSGSLLGATTSDYCDVISHPERRNEVVGSVLAELFRGEFKSLSLASIPSDSATVAALRAASGEHRYRLFAHPAQVCAQVILGTNDERKQVKASLLKKGMLRRSFRAMDREGSVTVSHLRSQSEIEQNFPFFASAHVARFLVTKRMSTLATPERRHFLLELTRLLSDSGWVSLSCLRLGERRIAWNFGFQFVGSWFWYQPTFDSTEEKYSPGFCLLSKIISEACDDSRFHRVDLGIGAEGYKDRFANGSRQTFDIKLNQSLARHARVIARHWSASAIKTVPIAESVARASLRQVASVRRRLYGSGLRGVMSWATGRMRGEIARHDAVNFYEWNGVAEVPQYSSLEMKPLSLDTLAQGAIADVEDADTVSYLSRAANRLLRNGDEGFALFTSSRPVHYSWVRDFEGFYVDELGTRLKSPSENAVIIFDC